MSGDLISRSALLSNIKNGLDNFPPFVDDAEKVDWIMRWIENAPAEQESHEAAGVDNSG